MIQLANYHEKKTHVRRVYGEALREFGNQNEDVLLLTDDLRVAILCEGFIEDHPDRFIENGIAEQNMMGMAAGLASCGKIPFVTSYATFATWRVAEQLRNDVSYTKFNVKIASMTTGVTFGQGGMSHQTFEDIALTRVLPDFIVLVPADGVSTREATFAAGMHKGPIFLRLGRDEEYDVYAEGGCPFQIGGSNLLREGGDILLVACGFMVREALVAAEILDKNGISAGVLDLYSIKPIDKESLFAASEKYGAMMTIEEHFTAGGMGSAVMEAFSGKRCPPILLKGIHDEFPPIGPKFELREHIGLCASSIAKDAEAFLKAID